MQDSLMDLVRALARASRFTAFLDGTSLALADGRSVQLKVARAERSIRPPGLRLSKVAFRTEIQAGDFTGIGFGEAGHDLIALQKSIAEAAERAIYKFVKLSPLGTATSNGWAAHFDETMAVENASGELAERDAVLVHWLTRRSFTEAAPTSLPPWLKHWVAEELVQTSRFKRLRILVGDAGFLPVVVTILQDELGYGVISHATAKSPERAIFKALTETCRIAQIVDSPELKESSSRLAAGLAAEMPFTPEDHAAVYAHHLKVPEWMFGRELSWKELMRAWHQKQRAFRPERLDIKFHAIARGPLTIGYCTSNQLQNLYFGRTQDAACGGLLNLVRLKGVMPSGEFNPWPHCVP